MNEHKKASFGSWRSPITSDSIVAGSVGLAAVTIDGEDIYWLEGRPSEGGRYVIVKRTPDGKVKDITPKPFYVRNRVHEYGGGSFLIVDGTIYFVNFTDQRIYTQTEDTTPQPITAESPQRYADMRLDKKRNRLICVCEDHSKNGVEPENTIVSVDLETGKVKVLVAGSDFYSSPRISPDGKQLAWLRWNHPNMPWDSTILSVAEIKDNGELAEAKSIAGGEKESICQPEWSAEGILYFSSDRSDWWNLYRQEKDQTITPIYPMEAEFGYPQWVFGESIYGFVEDSSLLTTYTENGSWYLGYIDQQELQVTNIPYNSIHCLQVSNKQAVFIGGSPTSPTAVVRLDLEKKQVEVIKQSIELEIESGYLSIPEAIAFPTENNLTAYAWFYPPQNKDYTSPKGELPPLIVKSHGGPTAATAASFNLKIQYWTSRGFAFLDVNYGGSTGYGRAYRERLNNNWGIVDVDDCVNAAKYLVKQGKVDGEKLAIAGGSAGGYTTLAALTFQDTFKAGASYYGVSDLEALATDTHKFESRYLDGLIGKYPEEKEIYKQRSPIYYTDKLNCPIIFFQGLEDKIVPPNQAEKMVEAIKAKGLPVAYVAYEGEQHGFRKAENIKRTLDAEYYFYAQIFNFTLAEPIEPVEIITK